MRGHGRSGKPETEDRHTSKHYADDFAAVAKEFQLVRPIFVGWYVLLLLEIENTVSNSRNGVGV